MQRTRPVLTTILLMLGAVASCGVTDPDVEADGIVRFVDVEGGCWGIETEEVMYEPINLPASFRVDGLRVDFEAEERKDLASICAIGVIVELTEIRQAGGP